MLLNSSIIMGLTNITYLISLLEIFYTFIVIIFILLYSLFSTLPILSQHRQPNSHFLFSVQNIIPILIYYYSLLVSFNFSLPYG